MVIWVKKEAVRAACNQRATVEGIIIIDEHYNQFNIKIKLLGTDEYFNIKPADVVGIEIEEKVILQFSCVGHIIKESQ